MSSKLTITCAKETMDKDDIREWFGKFGRIKKIHDFSSASAIIEFADAASAKEALKKSKVKLLACGQIKTALYEEDEDIEDEEEEEPKPKPVVKPSKSKTAPANKKHVAADDYESPEEDPLPPRKGAVKGQTTENRFDKRDEASRTKKPTKETSSDNNGAMRDLIARKTFIKLTPRQEQQLDRRQISLSTSYIAAEVALELCSARRKVDPDLLLDVVRTGCSTAQQRAVVFEDVVRESDRYSQGLQIEETRFMGMHDKQEYLGELLLLGNEKTPYSIALVRAGEVVVISGLGDGRYVLFDTVHRFNCLVEGPYMVIEKSVDAVLKYIDLIWRMDGNGQAGGQMEAMMAYQIEAYLLRRTKTSYEKLPKKAEVAAAPPSPPAFRPKVAAAAAANETVTCPHCHKSFVPVNKEAERGPNYRKFDLSDEED